MFRRAIITDEVSQEPAEAVRLALRFGLEGVEIRSAWEKGPHELTRAEIRTLRSLVQDGGLSVCAVATPCFKCALDDPAQAQAHLEVLRRCLDLCGELGTTIVRVFTFWSAHDPEGKRQPAGRSGWPEVAPLIAGRLSEAADVAFSFGRRVGVENEPSVFGSNSRKVAELLARAGHPALGAVWDPGNDVYDPECERPYPEGYEAVSPHLVHIHIKDAVRDPASGSARAVPLGEGEVPYPSIFGRLIEDGYTGFVSLETHYRVAGPLSEEDARLPGGTAFSAGGIEASTLCLQRWEAMLSALSVAQAQDGQEGRV
jgi:sugar phosphate isomerase/epimerase